MTPEKPTIIYPSRFLSDTIAAMVATGVYCRCDLSSGATIKYRPGASWVIARKGNAPAPDTTAFRRWENELGVFRKTFASAGSNLGHWVQLQPVDGWYATQICILPTNKSLFETSEVTK